ncbi:serine/threonine-protein kinase [Catenulispora subtropica]|uniref:non-specific serine/threonine protein kinase n=1 Tax=Catenulispora subtropica TaxID=450798 RepID=A0ABN2SL17_9ACTN
MNLTIDETQPGHMVGGRYQLISEIGHGGMGRVWEARDTQLGRLVALKEVLLPALPPAQQEIRLKQAEREGKNAAALADHPHIVTVYDVIVDGGTPWIVMQLVKGRSLRSVLRDPADAGLPEGQDVDLTPLGRKRVRQIAEAMFSALETMHAAGIVHRDIKPHNILMADDGGILLTDFGIAKSESDATVTVSGSVMGTMAYIAPERAEGEPGSPASDFFSLGVTLFEAVEGFSPFERKNSKTGTLTAILTKPLPPMTNAGKLAPLIEALTLKLPGQRPNHDQALALLRGEGTGGWTMPSTDGEATETAPSNARPSGQASGNKKAKTPWESVTLTGSAGLPRPPLVDTPQPSAATTSSTKSGAPGWLGAVAGVLAVAGLIGYNVYQHHQDQQASTAPPSVRFTPSQPLILPHTTPRPVTTSHQDMTAGCSTANDAVTKFNSAEKTLPTGSSAAGFEAAANILADQAAGLNAAAAEANDSNVRKALQNEATLDIQLRDAEIQLADDVRDDLDTTSDVRKAQELLDQNSALDQARLHACQDAAHE